MKDALGPVVQKNGIQSMMSGAVLFRSSAPPATIAGLRYFQNSFMVIKRYEGLRDDPITQMMRMFHAKNLAQSVRAVPHFRKARSFRIVTSYDNQLRSPDRRTLSSVEGSIKKALRIPSSRAAADLEIWFLHRREGLGLALLRLSRRLVTEKDLRKGELRPELAHLLCLMSKPAANDAFLDPFCGYGAIVVERSASFPVAKLYGADTDSQKIELLRNKIRRSKLPSKHKIDIQVGDATSLMHFADGSIAKVVTDPPWGDYRGSMTDSIANLYAGFIKELERVLAPDGLAVLLLGRDSALLGLVNEDTSALNVDKSYKVLVAGKKALACTITKKSI